jgi:hypothetical protein
MARWYRIASYPFGKVVAFQMEPVAKIVVIGGFLSP